MASARAMPERTFARPLTPDEVVALGRGERVAHLRDDVRVAAIRRCALNGQGEQLFRDARERGYVVLPGGPHLTETCGRLATLWGWWCAAAKRPEATIDLRLADRASGARVRVDLAPTGRAFLPAILGPVGRVWAEYVGTRTECGGWLVTPDVVELYAPDLDGAGALVWELLRLSRDERWLVAGWIGGQSPVAGDRRAASIQTEALGPTQG